MVCAKVGPTDQNRLGHESKLDSAELLLSTSTQSLCCSAGEYWSRDIGYAKIGDTWGIALRDISGNHDVPEAGYTAYEEWLFNDAPRWLRIEGVGKIADLLESLIKQADTATQKIRKKTAEARELATAISAAAVETKDQRK
jgi:hypothetical protein